MAPILNFIKLVLTEYKMKIIIFIMASIGFVVLLFPFGDLSDKITNVVSAQSNNTVYLQFDDLSLGLMPLPALKMYNVIAEVQGLPEMTMTSLSAAPSLLALIKQQPLGRVYGQGFFKGDLDLSVSSSSKMKDPQAISADLEYTNFDLAEVFRALSKNQPLPLSMSGTGQIQSVIDIDPTMKAQPDGEMNIAIKDLKIPAFSVPLAGFGGSLAVPGLDLDKVQLKGTMKNGKFTITDSTLGSPKDELSGKITGDMDVRIQPTTNQITFGAYNLAIDLTIGESLQSQLGSYMGMVDMTLGKFKRSSVSGTRYSFRLQGTNFQGPPAFESL